MDVFRNSTITNNNILTANIHNDIPTANKILESIIMCIIIVICLVGNIALWIVVLGARALRSATSMFILGLSAADFLVALVNMPVTIYTVIVGFWPFSQTACVVVGYVSMFTLVCSVMSLCNISINRYFKICKGTRFQGIYNTRTSAFMITAVVIISALLSSLPLIGWSQYVYTPMHSICFADWTNHMSFAGFMIVCCFEIPLGVMTVCNILIIRAVRTSARKVMFGDSLSGRSAMKNISQVLDLGDMSSSNDAHKYECNEQCTHNILNRNVSAMSPECNTMETSSSRKGQQHTCTCISKDKTNIQDCNITTNTVPSVEIAKHVNLTLTERLSYVLTQLLTYLCIQNNGKLLTSKQTATVSEVYPKPSVSDNARFEHEIDTHDPQIKHYPLQMKLSFPISSFSLSCKRSATMGCYANNKCTDMPISNTKGRDTHRLRRSEEIHLTFSLLIVVLLFVICWLPYCLSMTISMFFKGHVSREFNMFTLIIGYANSGCNPIVYGVMNQRFKVGFKNLLCFWKSGNRLKDVLERAGV